MHHGSAPVSFSPPDPSLVTAADSLILTACAAFRACPYRQRLHYTHLALAGGDGEWGSTLQLLQPAVFLESCDWLAN